jgi:hypothetical protein
MNFANAFTQVKFRKSLVVSISAERIVEEMPLMEVNRLN